MLGTMTTDAKLLTAEEFMQLSSPPDGGKMELVRGQVVTMAPVGGEHGGIAAELVLRLRQFSCEHGLGRTGVEIGYRLRRDPDLVRAPDVSFIAYDRLPGGALPEGFVDGPPSLAIEVVSPWDRDTDISVTIEDYLAAGTPRAWVVRPRTRTVTVHRPGGEAHTYHREDTLTSDDAGFEAEGFSLPVGDLFD